MADVHGTNSEGVTVWYDGVKAGVRDPGDVASRAAHAEAVAKEFVDRLSGLMKEEIASRGGPEAYLRWVRSEDQE